MGERARLANECMLRRHSVVRLDNIRTGAKSANCKLTLGVTDSQNTNDSHMKVEQFI